MFDEFEIAEIGLDETLEGMLSFPTDVQENPVPPVDTPSSDVIDPLGDLF